MSVHSRQPLIRISKNGEMRLKNKIGVAILKENAYEKRALDTKLIALEKHQERQEKYMTYRQLEFATKQITAAEERPHTIAATEYRSEGALPPIQAMNLSESTRRRRGTTQTTSVDIRSREDTLGESTQRSKPSWEKALSLVRLAVRNRERNDLQSKTFITQQVRTGRRKRREDLESSILPPLTSGHGDSRHSRHNRELKPISRQFSFPEMIKMSREKSVMGLQDPRFLKLKSCLDGEGGTRTTNRSIHAVSIDNERRSKID